MITKLKFKIFIINVFTIVNICIIFNINRFYLNSSMIWSFTLSSNWSIYTFFEMAVICIKILLFKVLTNLSATTDFPSLFVEYVDMLLSFNQISLNYYKLYFFYLPMSCLVISLNHLKYFEMHKQYLFLSFRGTTQAYLLLMSIKQEKSDSFIKLA